MLPLLKPAIVTACILKGVGVYNEYYSANLYLTKENLKTMAISLYTFIPEADLQRHYGRRSQGLITGKEEQRWKH